MGMITISSKLIFSDPQEIILLKDLMRRWSSALRYAYKRLIEGMNINTIRKRIQELFKLKARYSQSAIIKAQSLIKSYKGRGKSLESEPKRVHKPLEGKSLGTYLNLW